MDYQSVARLWARHNEDNGPIGMARSAYSDGSGRNFASGEQGYIGCRVHFHDECFYSYKTCVLRYTRGAAGELVVLMRSEQFSHSTQNHMRIARGMVDKDVPILQVPLIGNNKGRAYDIEGEESYVTSDLHKRNIERLMETMHDVVIKPCMAPRTFRSWETTWESQLKGHWANILQYSSAFNVPVPVLIVHGARSSRVFQGQDMIRPLKQYIDYSRRDLWSDYNSPESLRRRERAKARRLLKDIFIDRKVEA